MSGLQLGVDAARGLEFEGAGPGAGYRRAFDPAAHQEITRLSGFFRGFGDRVLPLLRAAQMLRRAVIGLQPGKGEMRRLCDLPREAERWLTRLDAAAVAAHVDLDIDRQRDRRLARRRVERADLPRIVDANADPRRVRERRQPFEFLPADDLVRDTATGRVPYYLTGMYSTLILLAVSPQHTQPFP
jgi:hypothetical protein